MRCTNCDKTFEDNLEFCPFCNGKNQSLDTSSNEDFVDYIELIKKMEKALEHTTESKTTKKKVRDDSEVSLDKTIAINIDSNSTLMDEINKQIENVNKESLEEKKAKEERIIEVNEELTTLESIKKRRKVFVITAVATFILLVFIVLILLFSNDMSNKSRVSMNFEQRLDNAVDVYYNSGEIDTLVYLMEEVKGDSDKIEQIQLVTKEECNNWLLQCVEEDAKSKKEFDDKTYKYRELIDGLYRYALVRNKNAYIRALTENDYDEIIIEFDNIYNQSLDYYEALDLYNAKDYNRAYYMFSKIEEENTYYSKSVKYIEKIYDNIIAILEKDIVKIEKDIDTLNDEEKLNVYIIIEETILEYNNVYNVNLSEQKKYQEILSTYTSKVSEYTEIVYNN